MSKILLDGKYADAKEIDPAKHRYVGMFRPPVNPCENVAGYIQCTCGQTLTIVGQSNIHWRQGCCDVPQYATIPIFAQPSPIKWQEVEAGKIWDTYERVRLPEDPTI